MAMVFFILTLHGLKTDVTLAPSVTLAPKFKFCVFKFIRESRNC